MATDTHKYALGETPEAVIRERLGFEVAQMALFFGGASRYGMLAYKLSDDDLLTVLDALKQATPTYTVPVNGGYLNLSSAPAQLRISILAALGIDESADDRADLDCDDPDSYDAVSSSARDRDEAYDDE